jgi:hypothetical protein
MRKTVSLVNMKRDMKQSGAGFSLCFILLFPFSFLLSASCMAQHLKVMHATEQCWSGGMVRINHINSGTDYTIVLSPIQKDIVFKYLYIVNSVQNLDPPNGYVWADSVNNTYTIHAGACNVPGATLPHFKGAGLIVYTCKGKSYELTIDSLVGLTPRNNLQ